MEKFNPYVILLESSCMQFFSGHTNKTEDPYMDELESNIYVHGQPMQNDLKKSQKKVIPEKLKSSESAFV